MTKTQKKQIISSLFKEIKDTDDIEVINKNLSQIIQEIYSSGFDIQKLKTVSNTIKEFISDVPNKIFDNGNSYFRNETSKTTLLVLIDLSTLPD